MEEVATIQFRDLETQNQGVAVIRAGRDAVAIALSVFSNGDVEAVIAVDEARLILNALRAAIEGPKGGIGDSST